MKNILLSAMLIAGFSLAALTTHAADKKLTANKSHSDIAKKQTSGRKKDAYSGWEMYQSSKNMGTNRMLLCPSGMKIINPLMSMAYYPKTKQLALINNSNHKYFYCTKERFPHYIKMLGFDIFTNGNKDIKYGEWKKIDTEKVASMDCVLYQRVALNAPPGVERKEQTWASTEISLPATQYQVYSELSGRVDACRFGFPMRSKVITNMPPDGFKVRLDFDTREVISKQFTANDFAMPKDYMEVKEFSEFLLNDSESKMARDEGKSETGKLQDALSNFKSRASAEKAKLK